MMRTKLLSLVCAIAVLMSFVCVPSQSAGESYIYLEHVSTNDRELVVNLCIRDLADQGIKSFGVYLKYSTNVSFVGCEFDANNGTGVSDDFILPGIPYEIVWTSADEVIGTDKVVAARLTFISDAPVSESDIELAVAIDSGNLPKDAAGNEISTKIIFAGMNIVGGVIPPTPVVEAVSGDANDDGRVNLGDATVMLQYIAKWIVGINTDNSDVNDDGDINLSDVTLILKYIARWDVVLK